MLDIKENKRIYRHRRIRQRVIGTPERLRLCVHRSHKNLQAHLVDDTSGKVLLGVSTLKKDFRQKIKQGGGVKAATLLGEILAAKAMEKGIKKVCFDRGGYLFHGSIKAFADAARKGGLEF